MRIEWTRKAFKHLLNVDNVKIREKIYGAVDQLRDWPVKKDVKVLKGREGYRLRVGKYRVIFNVFDTLKIISIEEVKKRDERTY